MTSSNDTRIDDSNRCFQAFAQINSFNYVLSILLSCSIVFFMMSTRMNDNSWIEEKLSNVNQRNMKVPEVYVQEKFISNRDELSHDPDLNLPYPRVAWLMSYPNSGTSFTMKLVHRGGQLATASNYGQEDKYSLTNVPLFKSSPNGPFILQPNETLPTTYILTKTHCGGRCVTCRPRKYVENDDSFMSRCAQGSKKIIETTNVKKNTVNYDPHLAQRAIHLIRNPFDNVVSNFHLEMHHRTKINDTNWLKTYTNDMEGFRRWCSYMDTRFLEEEKQLFLKDFVLIMTNEHVPCHAHFYRYAKWHDYAIKTIEALKLPSLTVFYEDYDTDFNKTTQDIFDFLGVSIKHQVPNFLSGKTYIHHFYHNERQTAFKMMKKLVSHKVWELLSRYDEP